MENSTHVSLKDVVEIIYATDENAKFYLDNSFLALELVLPYSKKRLEEIEEADKRAEEEEERIAAADEKSGSRHHKLLKVTPDVEISEDKSTIKYTYKRVYLQRAFPYENPFEYISVLNSEQEEICMIRKVDDIESRDLIVAELEAKYYEPTITKINELKDDMGFSHWDIETENGNRCFIVRDTHGSIAHVSETYFYVTDIDGNRYKIPDITALDKKSYKKIELFL